jgi:hypothetical protein
VLSNVIGLLFCLAMLALWFGVRREDRMALQRSCRHDWVIESLFNEGRLWYRRCIHCDKQEPVGGPQLRAQPRRDRRHNTHERG